MKVKHIISTVEGKAFERIVIADGNQVIAEIQKTADELPEVKVFEAFIPDLKGGVVEIQEGAEAPMPRKFRIGK